MPDFVETKITTRDKKKVIIRSRFAYSEDELRQLQSMNMRDLFHVGSVRGFREVESGI